MFWMVLISTATMLLSGRLGDRRRMHAGIAAFGIAVTIPGFAAVGLGHSLTVLSAGIALVGLGMGALGPSLLALVAALVAPERRGVLSVVLPVAVWLARLERRAARPAAGVSPLLNPPTLD